MPVKKGDKIKVEYEGKLEDGTVFDSSKTHGKPLEFEVGSGKVIKGFDEGVVGMEVNEEKEIKIDAKDAYGEHKPELIKKVPREQFPKEQEPKPGMFVMMGLPNGAQLPVKIIDVDEKEVTLDLNHPLAGKNLIFKVKLLEIA